MSIAKTIEKLVYWYRRQKQKVQNYINSGPELNKRVDIENYLFAVSIGKKPIPTKEEFRQLGLMLGTPKKLWRDDWGKLLK